MAELAQRLLLQEHDSPLGKWRLAVQLPPPQLAEAIEFAWYVEGGNPFEVARILPRGNARLGRVAGAAEGGP